MTKVTYLLGAGASYHAVSLVNEMNGRLYSFLKTFQSFKNDEHEITNPMPNRNEGDRMRRRRERNIKPLQRANDDLHRELPDELFSFYNTLKWLYEGMTNHSSVDTFAKKLYLKKNEESKIGLQKLKFALSAFLTIEQILSKQDMRYDKFFATILGEDIKDFPPNMNIISWNYDYQFEMAYSDYVDSRNLIDIQSKLNVIETESDNSLQKDKFSILKLNGTAGLHKSTNSKDEDQTIQDYLLPNSIKSTLHKLIKIHSARFDEKSEEVDEKVKMSFAWEKDSNISEKFNEALRMTTDLVVIGYSFPLFNSGVDLKIFDYLGLDNIYIQDKSPESVESSVRAIYPDTECNIDPSPSENLDEFFIPYDFIRERMNK